MGKERPDARILRRMRTRDRHGFTIIELLVTLVILSAGLLAIHGSSALTLRMIGSGWTRTLAATVAQTRLEQLRTSACAGASGSDETRGIRERWSLSPHRSSGTVTSVDIELTVEYLVRTQRNTVAERSATFRAIVRCA